jgi:hypothetical protein
MDASYPSDLEGEEDDCSSIYAGLSDMQVWNLVT